ncbi:putative 26S proteasome non-ATPase regulatory subunit 9 [Hypsibius exemplaris]|uniref:26S proteasome non-ATPase regulatory subunit 9 n=1 Tax=Hypsibius exemplaris TaxID=2072580 RepID=A0A1W0WK64_HYPEX|nr:putative 26S proteasome non-ATPase regulatory subunit 9 [Hypsibius exemplaris]
MFASRVQHPRTAPAYNTRAQHPRTAPAHSTRAQHPRTAPAHSTRFGTIQFEAHFLRLPDLKSYDFQRALFASTFTNGKFSPASPYSAFPFMPSDRKRFRGSENAAGYLGSDNSNDPFDMAEIYPGDGPGVSNPHSSRTTSGSGEPIQANLTRADVMALIRRKEEIEGQVKALQELLISQENVGMDGPLLDAEGFPRVDIDVYSVRHARHSIICLNNDHMALMKEIEEGLNNLHSQTRGDFMDLDAAGAVDVAETVSLHPFAKIQFVLPDSPAAAAGLMKDDLITVFGSATEGNFRSLTDISVIVGNSENRSIPVQIIRSGVHKAINLVPQKWSGKGLLGCSFLEERKISF